MLLFSSAIRLSSSPWKGTLVAYSSAFLWKSQPTLALPAFAILGLSILKAASQVEQLLVVGTKQLSSARMFRTVPLGWTYFSTSPHVRQGT